MGYNKCMGAVLCVVRLQGLINSQIIGANVRHSGVVSLAEMTAGFKRHITQT